MTKKGIIFISFLFSIIVTNAQSGWFLGGSAGIGYRNYFVVSAEVRAGYEFNYRVALGSGLGAVICAGRNDFFEVTGIAEPFVRVCLWDNGNVFWDIHALGSFEFTDHLELCQIGVRPSIRFHVSENIDMAIDLIVLGAQYIPESGWSPSFRFSSMSGGMRMSYHF